MTEVKKLGDKPAFFIKKIPTENSERLMMWHVSCRLIQGFLMAGDCVNQV